jgi:hypothetical protein
MEAPQTPQKIPKLAKPMYADAGEARRDVGVIPGSLSVQDRRRDCCRHFVAPLAIADFRDPKSWPSTLLCREQASVELTLALACSRNRTNDHAPCMLTDQLVQPGERP